MRILRSPRGPRRLGAGKHFTNHMAYFRSKEPSSLILPPITAESPGSKEPIQELRNETRHREERLGIFQMRLEPSTSPCTIQAKAGTAPARDGRGEAVSPPPPPALGLSSEQFAQLGEGSVFRTT